MEWKITGFVHSWWGTLKNYSCSTDFQIDLQAKKSYKKVYPEKSYVKTYWKINLKSESK